MSNEWQVPRCAHGNILLGCPESDCPEQNAYVDEQVAQIHAYYDRQTQDFVDYLRSLAAAVATRSEP